MKEIKYKLY